jgi:hypothetical protein
MLPLPTTIGLFYLGTKFGLISLCLYLLIVSENAENYTADGTRKLMYVLRYLAVDMIEACQLRFAEVQSMYLRGEAPEARVRRIGEREGDGIGVLRTEVLERARVLEL